MKVIDRLYEYFHLKGIKPTALEKELGISNGYLGTQKKRNADMGESIITKIVDYCRDVSIEWLMTGQGNMLRNEESKSLQTPTIIYKSDPKDTAMIELQDKQIKLLEDKIHCLECEIENFDISDFSNVPSAPQYENVARVDRDKPKVTPKTK